MSDDLPTSAEPDTGADSLSQGGGAHASETDNPAVRGGGFRDPVSDEQTVAELMRLADEYANANAHYAGNSSVTFLGDVKPRKDALESALRAAFARPPTSAEPAKPSVPNPCTVCGVPIFGSCIDTGDGTMKEGGRFAHPECYWRQQATSGME